MKSKHTEEIRVKLTDLRETIDNTIRWHNDHLEILEQQFDPDYNSKLNRDDEQERLILEAYIDYVLLDEWKCIGDHINEMLSILDKKVKTDRPK